MPELGPYGSWRGAQGNLRPYRDPRSEVGPIYWRPTLATSTTRRLAVLPTLLPIVVVTRRPDEGTGGH
jgi:hypothetical protein